MVDGGSSRGARKNVDRGRNATASVRRLCAIALLLGSLAAIGGATRSASAEPLPDCVNGVPILPGVTTHFDVTPDYMVPHDDTAFAGEVGQPFSVTVEAKDGCDATVTLYEGPLASATLTGNLTGATYESGGQSSQTSVQLTFTDGVATATVTPATHESVRTLTATDNLNPSVTGTSAAFEVFEVVDETCSDGCKASVADNQTSVDVNVPSGAPGFLGVNLEDAARKADCGGGRQLAALHTILPPQGRPDPTITVTARYDKTVAPGTGVANFSYCKSDDPASTSLTELSTCPKQPSTACILKRHRSGVGDLVFTILIDSTDPVGGGYGG